MSTSHSISNENEDSNNITHSPTEEDHEIEEKIIDGPIPVKGEKEELLSPTALHKLLREIVASYEQLHITCRPMGVGFDQLTVTGTGAGVGKNATILSILIEPFRFGHHYQTITRPPIKTILHNFSGVVKPGEMCLVLGRPGAGCTTLLKTLASYRDGFREVKGEVQYQGFTHKSVETLLRGDVVYVAEHDQNFPTLNVGQTLGFAASARTPGDKVRAAFPTTSKKRASYVELVRNTVGAALGLRHTFSTQIGNEILRGVSGGESRRVTLGEALSTRARVMLLDNPTRGLDSSTAVEVVQALRTLTDETQISLISSMYQAGQSLTRMFEKVTLLYEGRQIYFGPLLEAQEYFYEMGYEPHPRQTLADFMVALTDPTARIVRKGYENRAPRSPDEFVQYWLSSPQGQRSQEETRQYITQMQERFTKDESAKTSFLTAVYQERSAHARKTSRYVSSWARQISLAIQRRTQILIGDYVVQSASAIFMVVEALIIGSVFYQMPKTTAGLFSRGGVLFFATLFNSFYALVEVTLGYAQRPIVIRQNRFAFLHPAADALANTLLDIVLRVVMVLSFAIPLYFLSGLYYSASAFFIFFFTTLLLTVVLVAAFRCCAAVTRSEAVATMFAGLLIINFSLYAGYVIPRPSMVIWWKWLSYCNPISFAFEILMTNEFRNLEVIPCVGVVPSGPGYENVSPENQVCTITGSVPGQTTINGLRYLSVNYGYEYANRGRNVGIIIGFFIFFIFIYAFASGWQVDPSASGSQLVYLRDKVPQRLIDEEEALRSSNSDVEKGEIAQTHHKEAETPTNEDDEEIKRAIQASDEIFAWTDICYDINVAGGKSKRLLNNVSGYVAPGKLTALMGATGAGKTTLLNVLAQRVDVGVVQGLFEVAGKPLPKSFQADTAYCQQQDTHLSTQTVREALQFSALLRQPAEISKEEKLSYVERVIRMLEMESFADAIVGIVGNGLSVEQRKRLTIGVELAARPKLLLFLDEPTSGLDAQAAWSVVRFLKKVASAGQAILCTIHQPSAELIDQFDRLLLLQSGGKTVFFGDIGPQATNLLQYFSQHASRKPDADENPAEYILDVIGAGAASAADRDASKTLDWPDLFLQSPQYTQLRQDLDRIRAEQGSIPRSAEDEKRGNQEYATSVFTQLKMVIWRAFVHYWRSPVYLSAKLMLNLIAGLFIASSFWAQGSKETLASLQNVLFAIFLAFVTSVSLAQQLQPVFLLFRNQFEAREKPSKAYSWPVMVTAALLVEIPWNLLGGTLYWIPWWYMIDLPKGSASTAYGWGIIMLYEIYFQTFASAMAALAPDPMLASLLFSLLFSFVIVFSGVAQPAALMPAFWRYWMFPLSPFTHLIEGMLGDIYKDKPIRCSPVELNLINPPAGQTCDQYLSGFSSRLDQAPRGSGYYEVLPGANGSEQCGYCQYRFGEDFLATVGTKSFSFKSADRFRVIGIVFAYIAFNIALAYGLFYLARIHKWKKQTVKAQPSASVSKADDETKIIASAGMATFGPQIPATGANAAAHANASAPTSSS
ncbi:uncharacterized protein FA14DRAFT_161962 [Meira miltonrushii]|uniref:ABC transporter domain-containing protein n=1 Tax=Meira miltonrushii TaxID=1280837 RepID=A0A316V7Z5_9BASI|nr:uncharacterized protein FA14DRAFT_161962 [Meira miltonrushii]PWN32591.1 hypothetical protein FA14DRAFT_161962 [Meira miltonrushii]